MAAGKLRDFSVRPEACGIPECLISLLLVPRVEKEFGIKIASEKIGREAFASVGTLARFVDGLTG